MRERAETEAWGGTPDDWRLARLAARLGLAPEGALIALPMAAVGIILGILGLPWLGLALLLIAAALAVFFRDPERYPPPAASDHTVLAGADGRVCDIGAGWRADDELAAGFTRLSIFMSPLNVHVNRAPVSGEVTSMRHTRGEFRAAFRDEASEHNERNTIRLKDSTGQDHVMVQIAGYLARRIVCRIAPHTRLERGQRLGLIMFGSRVDHFLPREYRVAVQVGDRVRAGETVIGERTS